MLYSIDGLVSVIMKMLYDGSMEQKMLRASTSYILTDNPAASDLAASLIAVENNRASASD